MRSAKCRTMALSLKLWKSMKYTILILQLIRCGMISRMASSLSQSKTGNLWRISKKYPRQMKTSSKIQPKLLIKKSSEQKWLSTGIFWKNYHQCLNAKSSREFVNSSFITRIQKSSRSLRSHQSFLCTFSTRTKAVTTNQELWMNVEWVRMLPWLLTKCLKGSRKMKSVWHRSSKTLQRSVTIQFSTPILENFKTEYLMDP